MAPNSNYDVKILTFKEAPNSTAILMCKYYAFKGASNSNFNVKGLCFQRGTKQQL